MFPSAFTVHFELINKNLFIYYCKPFNTENIVKKASKSQKWHHILVIRCEWKYLKNFNLSGETLKVYNSNFFSIKDFKKQRLELSWKLVYNKWFKNSKGTISRLLSALNDRLNGAIISQVKQFITVYKF